MSWNILCEYTRYVENYCTKDQIISLGPKGSIETNISKNSCFHDDKKKFLPFFPRFIGCDKHQGVPDFIRVQRYSNEIIKNDKTISLGPKMSIETNIFKKAVFTMTKCYWPISPPYSACEKPQGTIFKGSQANMTNTVENIKAFFSTWEVVGETAFPAKNRICFKFSRFIEHEKSHGTYCMITKGILTKNFKLIRSLL